MFKKTLTAIEDVEESIARLRKTRRLLKRHADILDALASEQTGYLFTSSTYPHVYYSRNVRGFTFSDEPELFDLLEYLSDEFGRLPDCTDSPQVSEREFTFALPDGFTCTVTAKLADDSTCQRVQVGTHRVTRYVAQEVEEPVFAFDCVGAGVGE
jgi:hypothetical protein